MWFKLQDDERAWEAFKAAASVYGALHPAALGDFPGWANCAQRVQKTLEAVEAENGQVAEVCVVDRWATSREVRLTFGTGSTRVLLLVRGNTAQTPAHSFSEISLYAEMGLRDFTLAECSRVKSSLERRAAAMRQWIPEPVEPERDL